MTAGFMIGVPESVPGEQRPALTRDVGKRLIGKRVHGLDVREVVLNRSMNSRLAASNSTVHHPKTAMPFGHAKASVSSIREELEAV